MNEYKQTGIGEWISVETSDTNKEAVSAIKTAITAISGPLYRSKINDAIRKYKARINGMTIGGENNSIYSVDLMYLYNGIYRHATIDAKELFKNGGEPGVVKYNQLKAY